MKTNLVAVDYFSAMQRQNERIARLNKKIAELQGERDEAMAERARISDAQREADALNRAGLGVR